MSARPRRTCRARRLLIAGLGLTALASTALAAGPAQADDASVARDLAKAHAATAKFAHEPLAVKAGFMKTDMCMSDPVLGGMGYHYVNPANIGSTDPSRPAAVLYEDGEDGKRHLVAAEWVVLDVGRPAPVMFDRKFDGPNVIPGLGSTYDRHVWLYKKTPSGLFARYNPKVKCPVASPPAPVAPHP
ncbi:MULTISPECIES: hypothetical protein [unclassified Streptomyces]|uniref:hypothetical protein n=1 Tax=unclassified Streptomyces TaxID=2593676 RepID=UPI002966DF2D|nr:hypothetical protein [Streptomyces sp. SJL17-1]